MTRRRGTSTRSDSLELLLDTICNTFGGVLFIALLVVLLLQSKESDAIRPPPVKPEGSSETLLKELEGLQADLARLKENRAAQQRVEEVLLAPGMAVMLSSRQKNRHEAERLLDAFTNTAQENQLKLSDIRMTEQELEDLDNRVGELSEQVDRLKGEIEGQKREKTTEIRLSEVHDTSSRQIGIVVRYGRLYVWHQYSLDGERLGLNDRDFVVVENKGNGVVTMPHPLRGLPIGPGREFEDGMSAILRRFRPVSSVLAFIVYPDSFHCVKYVRNQAVASRFQYILMIAQANKSIADRGGRGNRAQ